MPHFICNACKPIQAVISIALFPADRIGFFYHIAIAIISILCYSSPCIRDTHKLPPVIKLIRRAIARRVSTHGQTVVCIINICIDMPFRIRNLCAVPVLVISINCFSAVRRSLLGKPAHAVINIAGLAAFFI